MYLNPNITHMPYELYAHHAYKSAKIWETESYLNSICLLSGFKKNPENNAKAYTSCSIKTF